ncbi:MAG: hypothetical protein QOE41_4125 [Mycobacterium sp.]|jgi:hypothetical protein|nr:hypothetical protein [Mycobacterium sp.]MDT5134814.1 hypothetical protein [Mycobacterium sp.]
MSRRVAAEAHARVRSAHYTGTTSGLAPGAAQANLGSPHPVTLASEGAMSGEITLD